MDRRTTNANPADAVLDAMWENRERDEVPEPPMTDDELEQMYRYFHPEVTA